LIKKALQPFAVNTISGNWRFSGQVLREDFTPDSDIDVLVDFEPGHLPGLFGIARMERELSSILEGRKIDLRTAEDLSRYFRDDVLKEAEVQYAQG
jgi:predicted nucleotidyltransferase